MEGEVGDCVCVSVGACVGVWGVCTGSLFHHITAQLVTSGQ